MAQAPQESVGRSATAFCLADSCLRRRKGVGDYEDHDCDGDDDYGDYEDCDCDNDYDDYGDYEDYDCDDDYDSNYEDVVDASDDDCSGHEPVVGLATIFWLDKSWSIIGGHQQGWRSCTIIYG